MGPQQPRVAACGTGRGWSRMGAYSGEFCLPTVVLRLGDRPSYGSRPLVGPRSNSGAYAKINRLISRKVR